MKHRLVALLLAFVFAFCGWGYSNNDYMSYKTYDVEVVQTYSGTTGKGSSLSFVAVYKLDDGYRFDRFISAADYSMMQPGDKYKINLRPFDVKQNLVSNVIWFFGGAIVMTISFCATIAALICVVNQKLLGYEND